MIQEIITYIIVGVSVCIASVYIYKMFCSKKHNGCAGCSGCLLKEKMKEKEKEKEAK